MNLLDKRFRSKTSSAAPLPPVRLVLILSKSLSSLSYANYDTVSFAKEGYCSSLWYVFPVGGRQREVGRDFIKQCRHYYETVNKNVTEQEDLRESRYAR